MTHGADGVNLKEVMESDFTERRGQTFRIEAPSGEALTATLVEVNAHPHLPSRPGRRRGFSLVLRTEEASHLPQSIYRVEHADMGPMELFLVPIGPRGGGMCYEAVFN